MKNIHRKFALAATAFIFSLAGCSQDIRDI